MRTVAVPIWIKQAINAWMTAAPIKDGRLLRSIRKGRQEDRRRPKRLGYLVSR